MWLLMLFRINIVYLKHKNLVYTNTELLYTYKRMEWSDSSTMKLWQILRSQYWFKFCFISVWLLQLCEHFFFNFLEKSINVYLESSKSCPEVELKNVSVVLIKFSKQKKVALYYMPYILKDFYAGLSYFWGWLIKFFWCSHHQIGHRMVSCDL